MKISWYSIDRHEKIAEHEPIDLKQALEIADPYFSRGGEKFDNDEEATAATMFGFSKSKTEFIEICVNSPTQISYKFEFSNPNASGFRKLFGGVFRREEELRSRQELIQKVTEFFSHSSEQIVQRYDNKPEAKRSPLGNKPGASAGVRIFTIIFFSCLGLFCAYNAVRGIYDGKVYWGSRYHTGSWIYEIYHPTAFWIGVGIYGGIGFWLIRGCLIEIKTVKKMLRKGRKKKSEQN